METTCSMPKWKAWLIATRPKTLTFAIVPMVVGSAMAFLTNGTASFGLLVCAIISALFIQSGTNLVNDALDYKKGTDANPAERLGPPRVTQNGWLTPSQVLTAGVGMLVASVLCAIPLIYAGGWPIFSIITISALMGYFYTGGPYPLSYHGLGDLFVFLFFGLVATGSIYYIQTGALAWQPLLAGAQLGLICTIMIAINNYRDLEGDRRADKKTLAAKFGAQFARFEIAALLITPYLLGYIWWIQGYNNLAMWPLFTSPLALNILVNIYLVPPGRALNVFFGQASILHLLWGIALATGALL